MKRKPRKQVCDFCGKVRHGYMPINKKNHGYTICATCLVKGLQQTDLADVRENIGMKRYDKSKYPKK